MSHRGRFLPVLIMATLLPVGCDEPKAAVNRNEKVKGPELGRGTFRVFASNDPSAEPIAWVWRRPDIHTACRMEFWILRDTYEVNEPVTTKATEDLWFKPSAVDEILDHEDANGHLSFLAFRQWVIDHGSRSGGAVGEGELREQWVHSIARLP